MSVSFHSSVFVAFFLEVLVDDLHGRSEEIPQREADVVGGAAGAAVLKAERLAAGGIARRVADVGLIHSPNPPPGARAPANLRLCLCLCNRPLPSSKSRQVRRKTL